MSDDELARLNVIASLLPPRTDRIGVASRHAVGEWEAEILRNLQSLRLRVYGGADDADTKLGECRAPLFIAD